MLKKYIVVIYANLLLKTAFNSSPFGALALAIQTDREPSNTREEIISVNYESEEQDPSEAFDYIEIVEYTDGGNVASVANDRYDNEQDVELQILNKSVRSEEERGTQKKEKEEKDVEEVEEVEVVEVVEEEYDDDEDSEKDEEKESEAESDENEMSGEYIVQEVNDDVIVVQENINSIDELEDSLDSYRSLYSIFFVEFETTETYLNKIINCATDEEKNELLEDHIGILQEMYENNKKHDNYRLPFELRDSMALRISDRLRDYCFSEPLTDSYVLTLKSIFSLELEVFKGLFYYVKHKSTYSEKKEVINDLELIKFYHEELVTDNGLFLTDEQLDNAAMRVSNFVNDIYFLCFSNCQDMLIFCQIREANDANITM
ncbi:hypothetical protein PVIIG_04991 [Plasmodium vivax India VII]|uniref:Gamete antigen 27/25 n=1 Tax=Plasmodium vivax India VII TaxID=1077284 RepID=A0A0J9V7U0_PLAVI|nr:hypothetical protein PVIIG_04991 [Plasmodium vivax India VII]